MVYKILGVSSLVGRKSRKTGAVLNAYVFQLARENKEDTSLAGYEVQQQYLDASLIADALKAYGGFAGLVGCEADIAFNRNGFIDYVNIEPAE